MEARNCSPKHNGALELEVEFKTEKAPLFSIRDSSLALAY